VIRRPLTGSSWAGRAGSKDSVTEILEHAGLSLTAGLADIHGDQIGAPSVFARTRSAILRESQTDMEGGTILIVEAVER